MVAHQSRRKEKVLEIILEMNHSIADYNNLYKSKRLQKRKEEQAQFLAKREAIVRSIQKMDQFKREKEALAKLYKEKLQKSINVRLFKNLIVQEFLVSREQYKSDEAIRIKNNSEKEAALERNRMEELRNKEMESMVIDYNSKVAQLHHAESKLIWRQLRLDSASRLCDLFEKSWEDQVIYVKSKDGGNQRVMPVMEPVKVLSLRDLDVHQTHTQQAVIEERTETAPLQRSHTEETLVSNDMIQDNLEEDQKVPATQAPNEKAVETEAPFDVPVSKWQTLKKPVLLNMTIATESSEVTLRKASALDLDWLTNPSKVEDGPITKADATSPKVLISTHAFTTNLAHLIRSQSNLVSHATLCLLLRDASDDLTPLDLRWHLKLIQDTYHFGNASFCQSISDALFWKGLELGQKKQVFLDDLPGSVMKALDDANSFDYVFQWILNKKDQERMEFVDNGARTRYTSGNFFCIMRLIIPYRCRLSRLFVS